MSPFRAPRLRRLAALTLLGLGGSAAVANALRPAAVPEASESPSSVLGGQLVKGDGRDATARPFVVSGDVAGLAPGVTRPLFLRLSNPNRHSISVRTLEITVGDGRTGCPGSALHVGAFPGPVLLPGGGAAQVSVPVIMTGAAPSACAGAAFRLTYSGSAVVA